jgi:hypothetical protein
MTGLMRGFEKEYISGEPGAQVFRTRDQGGAETLGNIARWLDSRSDERPFLMFVNFLEAHLPYDPPLDYRQEHLSDKHKGDVVAHHWAHEFLAGLHSPELVDWNGLRRLYGGDVRYADMMLSDLVTMLRDRGLYDDLIIIVTSDHGENLGDHALVDHQFSVHETLLSVPLVVRAPNRLPRGRREDPVMLTDIFATVLDLAGVKGILLPANCRSLLAPPSVSMRSITAEYAGGPPHLIGMLQDLNPSLDPEPLKLGLSTVRVGDLRLTAREDRSHALHNVARDPGQEHDISSQNRSAVRSLYELLTVVDRRPEQPRHEIDEQMRQWLRSLGYIE